MLLLLLLLGLGVEGLEVLDGLAVRGVLLVMESSVRHARR